MQKIKRAFEETNGTRKCTDLSTSSSKSRRGQTRLVKALRATPIDGKHLRPVGRDSHTHTQFGFIPVRVCLVEASGLLGCWAQPLRRREDAARSFRLAGRVQHHGHGCEDALAGATTEGLAIFDGASGRTLERYVVIHPFTTIEGTARDRQKVALEARARGDKNKDGSPIYATDWTLGLAGRGGGTQIFVPYPLLGHLRGEGTEERRPYEWFKD